MSKSPNRASEPAGKPRRNKKEINLDLWTARQMLPLVRHIVTDIVSVQTSILRLTPELDRLDRHRRDLAWQERERRYQVNDEMAAAHKTMAHAVSELSALGVELVDPETGVVEFPTKINGRQAVYTWRLGEEKLSHWHYAGEEQNREIPADWEKASTRYHNQP